MKTNRRSGFTLIEVLVVVVIMLGLMSIIAGDVSKMFSGNDIAQGERLILDAFAKARSQAVTLEQNVAIYVSYRTLTSSDDQPVAKLWVVVGGNKDNDLVGSPLKNLQLDENDWFDFTAGGTVSKDDSILPISYILPHTLYVHGMQTDSVQNLGRGHYVRWYAVFNPDGSCLIIRPDGDDAAGSVESSAVAWQQVNDYLPDGYNFAGSVTSAVDTDLASLAITDPIAILMKDILEDALEQPENRASSDFHHLKLYSATEERHYILYSGSGKLTRLED